MAIDKLDKTFINRGETGYEGVPIDANNLNDVTNKIDEIIDGVETNETSIDTLNGSVETIQTRIDKTYANSQTNYGFVRTIMISNADMDDIYTYGSGLFALIGPITGTPIYSGNSGSHWFLIQIVHTEKYVWQIIKKLETVSSYNIIYMRQKVNDTWQAWNSISLS